MIYMLPILPPRHATQHQLLLKTILLLQVFLVQNSVRTMTEPLGLGTIVIPEFPHIALWLFRETVLLLHKGL
jgi:hypothetical protein